MAFPFLNGGSAVESAERADRKTVVRVSHNAMK